jgi:hypothetical protein
MTRLVVRAARPVWLAVPAPAIATAVIGLLTVLVTAAFGTDAVGGLGAWAVVAIGALIAVPAAPIVGVVILRRRNRRLELDDDTLSHVDDWGRRTTIRRDRIAAVCRVPLLMNIEYGEATVVTDRRGRALLSLWHKHWDADRLEPVWSALGRPVRSHAANTGTYRAEQARAAFPGLWLPLPFTHPFAVAGVAVTLVLAYVAGWIAVMVAVTAN